MATDLSTSPNTTTRDRILDAAAKVMREKGIARATTKEIAAGAGYSEALLYKHFADKQEIYMGVLRERVGAYSNPMGLVGTATVEHNLIAATEQLMAFYVESFPMSASIFSSTDLLGTWRKGIAAHGGGPETPLANLESYVSAEVAAGRLSAEVDPYAVASSLCGAAFQHAFLACFNGLDAVPDSEGLAQRLVLSQRF